jgi:hypothetical protein
MPTIEDHEANGHRYASNVAKLYEAEHGGAAVMALLYGMLCALARFNTLRRGSQDTFFVLSHIAEHEISPLVSLKCLEAEIAAELRKGARH